MDSFNIYDLSAKVAKNHQFCMTEEATKTSLIMPFFATLGYDTFNPLEVMPEAPCAIKGFDRIDYILASDGVYHMLVECKHWKENLDNHVKQLEQYFQAGLKPYGIRIGVLTNGIEYRFYADCDRDNIMDDEPFLIFDIIHPTEVTIERLKMFRRSVFDATSIVDTARHMRLSSKLHEVVERELTSPSDEFINMLWRRTTASAKLPKQHRALFTSMAKEEIANFTMTRIGEGMEKQMELTTENAQTDMPTEVVESLKIIRDILKDKVEADRLEAVPRAGYYAVRLDNNQWRPVCKLHLSDGYKWVTVGRYWPPSRKFYTSVNYKHQLNSVDDIRLYASEFIDIITIMLLPTHNDRVEWVNEHHSDWLAV